jgi:hypothetical protein
VSLSTEGIARDKTSEKPCTKIMTLALEWHLHVMDCTKYGQFLLAFGMDWKKHQNPHLIIGLNSQVIMIWYDVLTNVVVFL